MNANSPLWRNHAQLTQALFGQGHVAAAADAAVAWTKDFPDDAVALRAAAEISEQLQSPATGTFYLRAQAANRTDVTTSVRALWWLTSRHEHLDRLDAIAADLHAGVAGNPAADVQLRFLASLAVLRAGHPKAAGEIAAGEPGLAPHANLMAWLDAARAQAPGLAGPDTDLVLVVAVWGESFAGTFLRASLASLMHPSNLPALVAGRRATLVIMCDAPARRTIEVAPLLAALARLVTVRFCDIPATALAGNPGVNVLGPAQHVGFHVAAAHGADAIFLHADSVFAQGSLAHVRRLAESGVEMFCTSGFSATLEAMLPVLDAARGPDGSIGMPARKLVAHGFAHMHPRSTAMLTRADGNSRPSHPSLILFQERDYLRMRYFQPGPVWIARRLLNDRVRFNYDTSDNGLLHRLVAAAGAAPAIRYGADSDDFCTLDLAPAAQDTERTAREPVAGDLAEAIHADARQRGMIDALRLDAFATDCYMRAEGGAPWPAAPDCAALLADIEARCRADLAVPAG